MGSSLYLPLGVEDEEGGGRAEAGGRRDFSNEAEWPHLYLVGTIKAGLFLKATPGEATAINKQEAWGKVAAAAPLGLGSSSAYVPLLQGQGPGLSALDPQVSLRKAGRPNRFSWP